MIFCVVGAPLTGKTTVAQAVSSGLPDSVHVSSGDVARAFARKHTVVRRALELGAFAPPDVMDRAIINRIHEENKRYRHVVIDGYPRYFEQLLDVALIGQPVVVVVLEADLDTLARRNLERGRQDADTFERRMSEFRTSTQPTIEWLINRRRCLVVHNDDRQIRGIVTEILSYAGGRALDVLSSR